MLRLPTEIEAVIWDFNGTLIDDVDVVVQSVNPQLAKRGIAPMTTEGLRDVFGFPIESLCGADFLLVGLFLVENLCA